MVVAVVLVAAVLVPAEVDEVDGAEDVWDRLLSASVGGAEAMAIFEMGVHAVTSSAINAVWDFVGVWPFGVCSVPAGASYLIAEPPVPLAVPPRPLLLPGLLVDVPPVSTTPVSR